MCVCLHGNTEQEIYTSVNGFMVKPKQGTTQTNSSKTGICSIETTKNPFYNIVFKSNRINKVSNYC